MLFEILEPRIMSKSMWTLVHHTIRYSLWETHHVEALCNETGFLIPLKRNIKFKVSVQLCASNSNISA